MDDVMVDIMNHANGQKEEVVSTLLFELVGTKLMVAEQVKQVQEIVKRHKGYQVVVSTDEKGSEQMWRARKEVSRSISPCPGIQWASHTRMGPPASFPMYGSSGVMVDHGGVPEL